MNLAQRHEASLRYEHDALTADFKRWRNLTSRDDKVQKHFTQTRRITELLEELLAAAAAATPAAAPDPDAQNEAALNRAEARGQTLLFAQRTWAYFKSKFSLRYIDELRPMLKCADEFAWACYRPAWERARQAGKIDEGDLKEPPLIYLTGNESPVVQVREGRYAPEGIGAQDARTYSELLALPIPVIGLPWAQVSRLSLAVTLAHEVGHAVDEDFAVGAALDEAIRNLTTVPDARKSAWLAWRRELFADAWGVLCAGPAHLIALSDYLVTTPAEVKAERANPARWGIYPPRLLRIFFNTQLLAAAGLADVGVWQEWQAAYPIHGMMDFDDFAADAPHVASALLRTPVPAFGAVAPADVIQMTPEQWAEVKRRADQLPAITDITPKTTDARQAAKDNQTLFRLTLAAATWATHESTDPVAIETRITRTADALAIRAPGGTRGLAEDKAAADALYAAQVARKADAAAKLRAMVLGG